MDSRTIRERFVAFFAEREHTRVASSSLVPNDPTLLLTNAGMNQFKPYFLGEQQPSYRRAMSVQKCFRTTDIDEVGKTARHLTFFEMLGNFSFGDYYKERACPWAWELVTEGWGIDPERLWVTVYETDDEAHEIWADEVGVSPDRIIRMGRKTNFWSMGVAGPCGPCSEIYVDLGDTWGPAAEDGPAGNEDRYLEIWNLVFMQNECNQAIDPVAELPKKNIDTGAGVERLAMVLQGAGSIYETDTLGGMVEVAGRLTGIRYGSEPRADKALRILADHGRATAFLIADGVLPSNEERGYVLRRVMRRAVREARLVGRDEPVLAELVRATAELMGDFYPEVRERLDFVLDIVEREESHFDATLKQGMLILEEEINGAREARTALPGDVAFKLHDTYGFPIDLTRDIASESGIGVDEETFTSLMAAQRERARAARKTAGGVAASRELTDVADPTDFLGYEHLVAEGVVLVLGGAGDVAHAGDEVDIVLDRTAFYAEGGGQVGDRGVIEGPGGTAEVIDTVRVSPGVIAHRARVVAGELQLGHEVKGRVDEAWRRGCERAHTMTHILHWALRDRLGEHATQAGSLVEPGRLRFDFHHFDALGRDRLEEIAEELQGRVNADDAVRAYETSFDFARSIGAMAIFGEKYGDFVRVVEVGDYSKELCGGTHVAATTQIGVVVVTSEGSVGANLRRVEALVGDEGLGWLRNRVALLERSAALLKARPEEVAERIERLLATSKDMERRLEQAAKGTAEEDARRLLEGAAVVGASKLVVARRDEPVDRLRALAQTLRGRLGSGVVVLGAAVEGRANIVAAVTSDLVASGVVARDLLQPGAAALGGGGGGKPELAVAGGAHADRVDEALGAVEAAARAALS